MLHPDQEHTVTDLAVAVGVPTSTLHREIQRLVQAGILADRQVGRARLVRANPANRLVRPLTELVLLTFGPRTVIAEEFADLAGVEQVIVYGSWAARSLPVNPTVRSPSSGRRRPTPGTADPVEPGAAGGLTTGRRHDPVARRRGGASQSW